MMDRLSAAAGAQRGLPSVYLNLSNCFHLHGLSEMLNNPTEAQVQVRL